MRRARSIALAGAAALLAGGCGSTAAGTAGAPVTTVATTTTTVPPASYAPYNWSSVRSAALELGGGPTSTLSAVVSPGAWGQWLVAGEASAQDGSTRAAVWTSSDALGWVRTYLPVPTGTTASWARAATGWGRREVIVGSVTSATGTQGAVWVSAGPGQPFLAVPASTSLAGTTTTSTTTSSTGTSSTGTSSTTTAPAVAPAPPGPRVVVDAVGAGALGLFAGGLDNGRAAMWYSPDGQTWQALPGADRLMAHYRGARLNSVVSTPNGIFATGEYDNANQISSVAWYSSDGIHWSSTGGWFATGGDHVVSALVDLAEAGNAQPGSPGPTGLLAIGGARVGPEWQPAAWISPNGSSWSQASYSFPLDGLPTTGPGALVYAATEANGHLYAAGGSPQHQWLWESTDGLSWAKAPLPAQLADATGWHLGLAAADAHTLVLADNLPGQPYVLVRAAGQWYQPSSSGVFGRPLATAEPQLVDVNGALTMVVTLTEPGLAIGEARRRVVVLRSGDGTTWSAAGQPAHQLRNVQVSTVLAVPSGLLVAGTRPGGPRASGTDAFAAVSPDGGATWPAPVIGPGHLGAPGPSGPEPSPASPAATTVPATTVPATTVPATTVPATTVPGTKAAATTLPAAGGNPATTVPATTVPATTTTLPAGDTPGAVTYLPGPLAATAAGRVGNAQYVVGRAGPYAVDWYSPDGSTWQRPTLLDPGPQVGTESPLGSCSSGSTAVVVGTVTLTGRGQLPAAWASTDGSAWVPATFSPAPPPGSTTRLYGCLPTGNGFLAYGESNGHQELQQPSLWSSTDGVSWQQVAAGFAGAPVPSATGSTPEAQHANPPPPHGPAIAPLQDIALGTTTWLGVSGAGDAPQQAWPAPIGGTAGAGLVPVGLWSSTDAGNDWQQLATDLPVFASNYYAQATGAAYVGREPVVVGTVDGRLMVWVGAPAAGAPAGTG